MSFLNPVSEPVLRFKSTDAGAPQINYNSRVPGDVKAILKSCLVTGYGAKASAGWTAANEVANVIEFVSPSAAMSDYRLGIDDTSAAKTDWYYQYQDARTNPNHNAPVKSFSNADKVNAANGWQMLVSERGVIFIELIQHSAVTKLSARITYWGAVKSGLPSVNGKNICFFNVGHNSQLVSPYLMYSSSLAISLQLESEVATIVSTATSSALSAANQVLDVSSVDLISPIYLANNSNSLLVGELPLMLSKIVNATADLYGVSEFELDGRNVLSVCAGFSSTGALALDRSRTFLIRTDYWEY